MSYSREELIKELAPNGHIRAGLNFGNDVLVQTDPATGEARGIVPALAAELSRQFDIPWKMVRYERAGDVVEGGKRGEWDVCFLAIDPLRAEGIAFATPYVVIEGTYMVPTGSDVTEIEHADRAGVRIGAAQASAYDLYLTRALKNAEIFRGDGTNGVFQMLQRGEIDVMAAVRQPLVNLAAKHEGYRVLPGRFTDIRQAVGTMAGRDMARHYLVGFVEEMKRSGFVARALAESGQGDASVAPLDHP